MHAAFVAVASCVVVAVIEAQMDRRGQPDGDGVRTRAHQPREDEEVRRRREEEEIQRRHEAAIDEMRRRLNDLPRNAGHLQALQEMEPVFPEGLRPIIQEQMEVLQDRVRAAEASKPEE